MFAIHYFVIGDKSYNFYNFSANYYHNFSDLGNFGESELRTSGWSRRNRAAARCYSRLGAYSPGRLIYGLAAANLTATSRTH